jgi:hypothetical protein
MDQKLACNSRRSNAAVSSAVHGRLLADLFAERLLGPADQFAGRRGGGVHLRVAAAAALTHRRLAPRRKIGGQKLRPQRAQQLAVQPAGVLEADFLLGGMHIDVDQFGRHVEPQEADRLPAGE